MEFTKKDLNKTIWIKQTDQEKNRRWYRVDVTGKKLTDKVYYSYSGYKGNLKSITLGELLKKNPGKALWYAVRGMLPKNKLRDPRIKRMKLIKGTTTKYDNFKPINLYK